MAWSLFQLAQGEGLLFSRSEEGVTGRISPSNRQAVLSLLVLFDRLVVHELGPSDGLFRIPDLERDGFLEIIAAPEPAQKWQPLKSSWKPSEGDQRLSPPPASLRRTLALVQQYQPLVVERILTVHNDFASFMAKSMGITRRRYYNDFIDFSIAYATGNADRQRNTLLAQVLPEHLLSDISSDLFAFEKYGDRIPPTNVVLIAALAFAFAGEIGAIREISSQKGLGVASRYYSGKPQSAGSAAFSTDPSMIPRSFGLVRTILHEEGHFFPKIQDIEHALKLRRNPHLRSFREQLKEFHVHLSKGDREGLEAVRKEVTRAKRSMERKGLWDRGLNWLTYMSLPAGLAESLLGGPPIAGTSMAVLSAAGTAISTRKAKSSEWVLFGM